MGRWLYIYMFCAFALSVPLFLLAPSYYYIFFLSFFSLSLSFVLTHNLILRSFCLCSSLSLMFSVTNFPPSLSIFLHLHLPLSFSLSHSCYKPSSFSLLYTSSPFFCIFHSPSSTIFVLLYLLHPTFPFYFISPSLFPVKSV